MSSPELPNFTPKEWLHIEKLMEFLTLYPDISVVRNPNGTLKVVNYDLEREISLSTTTNEIFPKNPDRQSPRKIWLVANEKASCRFSGIITRDTQFSATLDITPPDKTMDESSPSIYQDHIRTILADAIAGVELFHAYTLVEPLCDKDAKHYFDGRILDLIVSEDEAFQGFGYTLQLDELPRRRVLREIGVTTEETDPFFRDELILIKRILGNQTDQIAIHLPEVA